MGIKFDMTVSLGTLIHLGGMLLAGLLAYMKIHERMGRVEDKVDLLMDWFKGEVIPPRERVRPQQVLR